MNREIKFRAWYESENEKQMLFVGDNFGTAHPLDCCVYAMEGQPVKLMQCAGLKDKNGTEIYDGDLLNIFFTSGDGEYIHDCIYKAEKGGLGGVQFRFVGLMWSCHAHNQYPSSTTLCEKYESLDYEYEGNEIKLKVPDSWGENHLHGNRWKQNDKSFYFEIIGNIYENPELLEQSK